jgi:hypothetical protein
LARVFDLFRLFILYFRRFVLYFRRFVLRCSFRCLLALLCLLLAADDTDDAGAADDPDDAGADKSTGSSNSETDNVGDNIFDNTNDKVKQTPNEITTLFPS